MDTSADSYGETCQDTDATELGNERDIDRYVGLIINALYSGTDTSTP
jgi:hypothetical protein